MAKKEKEERAFWIFLKKIAIFEYNEMKAIFFPLASLNRDGGNINENLKIFLHPYNWSIHAYILKNLVTATHRLAEAFCMRKCSGPLDLTCQIARNLPIQGKSCRKQNKGCLNW